MLTMAMRIWTGPGGRAHCTGRARGEATDESAGANGERPVAAQPPKEWGDPPVAVGTVTRADARIGAVVCGIAGTLDLALGLPSGEQLVARMTEVQAHRGPDGAGLL